MLSVKYVTNKYFNKVLIVLTRLLFKEIQLIISAGEPQQKRCLCEETNTTRSTTTVLSASVARALQMFVQINLHTEALAFLISLDTHMPQSV